MIRSLRPILLFQILALAAYPVYAQVATGTPPFSSSAGGPDVIDLANLNAHIDIPVLNKPGRGGYNFTYDLSYDTSLWFPSSSSGTNTWTPAGLGNWGWRGQTEIATGYVSRGPTTITCPNPEYPPTLPKTIRDTLFSNYVYHDSFGISHPFNGMTFDPGLCAGETSASGTANDGSGYVLTVTTAGNTITSTRGDLISAPTSSGSGAGSKTDRNGNEITVNSSGQFFDTLSSTTPVLTVSGTPPSNTVFTYTAPSGASASYTVKYTTYSIQTNFGCSGITEYGTNGSMTASLVSEIDLPDFSVNPTDKYTFAYEPTPGHTGFVTGRLASVTLPTGGTISYSYAGPNNGIVCTDGSTATLTRTTPDSTTPWTYAHSESGTAWTTLITDPQGNQTNLNFQGIYETQRQVYQGTISGTLLRQWAICYNGNTTNCNSTSITLPITQQTITDQYGTSGLQCQHVYKYDSGGGLTEQDDYDYGSGAHGSLLRQILVTYASLGNITAFRQTFTVKNGSGATVSQTNYNYDQPGLQSTSGLSLPQHVSVSGSRGNLTSINYPVSGLTANFQYYDTGSPYTSQDVNGATTTYNYSGNTADCQMAFPTSINEPLGLSRSSAWNCTGGVQAQLTDENGNTASTAYTDQYFWRPASTTDQTGAVTNFCYAALSAGSCPTVPSTSQAETYLNFNSGNSTADSLTTLDSLGRVHVQQTRQSPSSSNFDSVEIDYDSLGRVSRTTLPYVGTAGQTSGTAPALTTTYDALSRALSTSDAGGGSTSYTYTQNDVLSAVAPAPTGESTKRRQLEYDSLGRLTSVCEITTTLSGNGPCAQSNAQTGYWTKYAYDALGDLLTVTQNAQAAAASQQTRTYAFDAMSRLSSEVNPETGTTVYTYDTIASGACASTFKGDLIKRLDAIGNATCYTYDTLHRPLSIAYTTTGTTVATPTKSFVYDSATVATATMQNAKTRLAEAYTGPSTAKITDEGFNYTTRGELTDAYELTPHSPATYYHVSQSYWANGAPNILNGNTTIGIPNITYGVDGEGRFSTTSAGSGQNPVTATVYNVFASPNQMSVSFGSGDSDIFSYDPSTSRMNKYQFKIGTQTVTGTLGWNANGSLGSLNITDPFSTANTQNCSFAADDVSRISQANCGTIWGQTFSYDPFGNIQKTGTPGTGGSSFTPTYQSSPSVTNRVSSVGGVSATYDANGNSLNDTFRTATWDAENRPVTIGSVGLTYDALGRTVEQAVSSTYSEVVYSPAGLKFALMNGTTLTKAFVPLPGGDTAVYNSSGLAYYRHTDHLGSSRFASTPTQTLYSDTAYSPFGEPYASSGAIDNSFTGQNQDTTAGLYDFLYREHDPNQARWTSPDPAGLAAVDPTNPQSWNRYAYLVNGPLNVTDQGGLGPCPLNDNGDSPCGTGGSCTVDGQSVDCGLANAVLAGGFGGQLPTGVSQSGFINGYYYYLTLSSDQDGDYFSYNYFGLTDAQIEILGLPTDFSSNGSGSQNNGPQSGSGNSTGGCEAKVFSAVNNQFGTNFTSANLFPKLPEFQFSTGAPAGQGTLNLNISGSGVSPGRYPVNWWTYVIGYGSTLHIPAGPFGLDSPQTLNFSSSQFTAHLDSAFVYNPIGALLHLLIDVKGVGGYKPCP
jgi:RHS repeat-associated protein